MLAGFCSTHGANIKHAERWDYLILTPLTLGERWSLPLAPIIITVLRKQDRHLSVTFIFHC